MAKINLNQEGKLLEILFKETGSHYGTWINKHISLLFEHESLNMVGVEISLSDEDYEKVVNAMKGDLNVSDELFHKLLAESNKTSTPINETITKILEDRFAPAQVASEKISDSLGCNVCKGTGYMQILGGRQCDQCGGSGKYHETAWTSPTPEQRRILISENIKKNKALVEAIDKSRKEYLAGRFRPSQRSMTTPCGSPPKQKNLKNVGLPWSPKEEHQLAVEYFQDRLLFREMAEIHGRTEGAIKSHLMKLGYMTWDKAFHTYRPNEYFDDFVDADEETLGTEFNHEDFVDGHDPDNK